MVGDSDGIVAAGGDRHHAAERTGSLDIVALVADAAPRHDLEFGQSLEQFPRLTAMADDPCIGVSSGSTSWSCERFPSPSTFEDRQCRLATVRPQMAGRFVVEEALGDNNAMGGHEMLRNCRGSASSASERSWLP